MTPLLKQLLLMAAKFIEENIEQMNLDEEVWPFVGTEEVRRDMEKLSDAIENSDLKDKG
jgi:hypothetical protein